MHAVRTGNWRRIGRWVLGGTALGAGVVLGTSLPASAATTATFSNGVLTVFGDNGNNTIDISRNASDQILTRPKSPSCCARVTAREMYGESASNPTTAPGTSTRQRSFTKCSQVTSPSPTPMASQLETHWP